MEFLDWEFNQHTPEKEQTVSSTGRPISQKVKAVSRHFNRVTGNLVGDLSERASNYPRASRWVTLVLTKVFILLSYGLWPCRWLAVSILVFSINLELVLIFSKGLRWKYYKYEDLNYFWDQLSASKTNIGSFRPEKKQWKNRFIECVCCPLVTDLTIRIFIHSHTQKSGYFIFISVNQLIIISLMSILPLPNYPC